MIFLDERQRNWENYNIRQKLQLFEKTDTKFSMIIKIVQYQIHKLIITLIPEIVGCYPFHVERKMKNIFQSK